MKFTSNKDFENLKEVTSINLLSKGNKFDNEGIFSPSLFGSNDFSCNCGNLKGSWYSGEICESCNSTISNPKDNIYKHAKLKIPKGFKIFNPIIYMIICKYVKGFEYKINPQYKQLDVNGHIIYDRQDNCSLVNFIDFTLNYKETIEKVIPDNINLSKNEIEESDEESEKDILNLKFFLLENEDSVMLDSIPILPIHLRPSQVSNRQMVLEPLNKCYISMNTHICSLRDNIDETELVSIEKELYEIQTIYIELATKIIEILSTKDGLCRDQILSNKILFSGRAVVSLKEDNDPETVIIPRIMFLEMYLMRIVSLLVDYLKVPYSEAYEYYILNRFNEKDEIITKCIDDILLTKPMVILNRNPSLHLLSLQSFYIKEVSNDNTIKLSKQVLRSYNCDFDGDTLAVFTLHTEEAKKEAEKIMIKNNLVSHKSINIDENIMPYQDNCLGIYLMDYKNA